MLGFVGREAGDNWEEWRDYLHYLDYPVLLAILGLGIYALWRWRRSSKAGESATAES
jgi:membrane protein DedA with SNARE-associated domain